MIIAGNCLMVDKEDVKIALKTAWMLKMKSLATHFRCKVWGGGTSPERYEEGYRFSGISILEKIDKNVMPVGTEIQMPSHIDMCRNLSFVWIGARNCQNYALMDWVRTFRGDALIKRGTGITIEETIGIYDIMEKIMDKKVYIIERGINTFDRTKDSRWSPDLKGIIRIKHERPDIFERLMVDCSHSVGKKEWSKDVYNAFKSIGVKHFMFECSTDPEKSKTDKNQILSIEELENILKCSTQ